MKTIFLIFLIPFLTFPIKGKKIEYTKPGIEKIEVFKKIYNHKNPCIFSDSLFFDGEFQQASYFDTLGRPLYGQTKSSNSSNQYEGGRQISSELYHTRTKTWIKDFFFEENDSISLRKTIHIKERDTIKSTVYRKCTDENGNLKWSVSIDQPGDTTHIGYFKSDALGNIIQSKVRQYSGWVKTNHFYTGTKIDSTMTEVEGQKAYISTRCQYDGNHQSFQTFNEKGEQTWEVNMWDMYDAKRNLIKAVNEDAGIWSVTEYKITYRE